jgi:predicted ATP-dependent Lon-type protease
MNPLSAELNDLFAGRVVRKDLVQRVKKGSTNHDLRPCMETKVNIFKK